jgi:hypothetical protein
MRLTNKQREEILTTLCQEMEHIRAIPLERIHRELMDCTTDELCTFTLGDILDMIQEDDDAN